MHGEIKRSCNKPAVTTAVGFQSHCKNRRHWNESSGYYFPYLLFLVQLHTQSMHKVFTMNMIDAKGKNTAQLIQNLPLEGVQNSLGGRTLILHAMISNVQNPQIFPVIWHSFMVEGGCVLTEEITFSIQTSTWQVLFSSSAKAPRKYFMAEIFKRKTILGEYSRKNAVSVGIACAQMKVLWLCVNVCIFIFKTINSCLIHLNLHMDLDIYSRESKTDLRLKTEILVFFCIDRCRGTKHYSQNPLISIQLPQTGWLNIHE